MRSRRKNRPYAGKAASIFPHIEIQQEDEGADPRRPRFHGAMMDTHALKASQDFKELPERYVIFITRNDVLGLGRTAYVIHKYIEAEDELLPFDDGTHLIYVNGAAKDDGTELWKLIHDLQCANADEMYFPRLALRRALPAGQAAIPRYDKIKTERAPGEGTGAHRQGEIFPANRGEYQCGNAKNPRRRSGKTSLPGYEILPLPSIGW